MFNALKIRDPHCRAYFSHLAVSADVDDIVITRKAEVFHQPDFARQLIAISGDGTPLESVQEFCGVKTQNLSVAKTSDHAALIRTTKSVSCIEEQGQTMLVCDLGESGDVAWSSPHMHSDNPGCFGCD